VVLPADFPRNILADSKKLSAAQREAAEGVIRQKALAWGIGWASAAEIDEINILQASLLAMRRAFLDLRPPGAAGPGLAPDLAPEEAVVDGLYTPDIAVPCRALVKADSLVPEVMAASILAKTARDREMIRYSRLYPEYGYDTHKGYPTKAHREAIVRYGPSPIQRMSFRVRLEE
jgi:ribonuclease HII